MWFSAVAHVGWNGVTDINEAGHCHPRFEAYRRGEVLPLQPWLLPRKWNSLQEFWTHSLGQKFKNSGSKEGFQLLCLALGGHLSSMTLPGEKDALGPVLCAHPQLLSFTPQSLYLARLILGHSSHFTQTLGDVEMLSC